MVIPQPPVWVVAWRYTITELAYRLDERPHLAVGGEPYPAKIDAEHTQEWVHPSDQHEIDL